MEKRSKLKVAMTYGLMYGLVNAIISLILYFMGVDMQSSWPRLVSIILLIITIIFGIKSYRDQDHGGFISYGSSLGAGTLIGLFGGIVGGIYAIVFFKIIAPEMVETILNKAQEQMIEQERPENQIEMSMKVAKFFLSPIGLFLISVVVSTFWGFISSLFISVFIKRERSPFDQPTDIPTQN